MVAEQGVLAALAATGFIWVRYSLVIKPINYSLAAVCICVCIGSDSVLTHLVCFVGELFCWINWPRAACAYCPVSCAFSCSKLRSNGPLFHSYHQTHKSETAPGATA